MFRFRPTRDVPIPSKPCSCGFGGEETIIKHNDRQPAFNYCPNINKLDNHVDCPSFNAICHEDAPCKPYWASINGSFKQIRRWCLMGEIEEVDYFIRPKLTIRTRFDEKVKIHFYLEEDNNPLTFSFNDALIGHTMLIMYPEKHDFLDMSIGIRQEFGDLVVIFKCPMQTMIKTFGSMMAPEACFQCGAKPSSTTEDSSSSQTENPVSVDLSSHIDQDSQTTSANLSLKKCSRCRTALYCNKLCQTQHWEDGHKKLCSSMKYLELLRKLDFTHSSVTSRKHGLPFSFAV
ncbi:unnamed protein product [Rotaria magnacalcarata]|uniref:MYND-type domain-containing protein n=1 Tax=Rotaria magnacalcarata TaxID=392030 RepID=A0A816H2S1_9BILA|nr:unnamed protein product [Rotaria magnacalcarata]CAF4876755.1 unnamed protein product [Rotaria magnacalcarata]